MIINYDHVYVQCQTAELHAASVMCQNHDVLHTISKLISFNSTYVVMLVVQDHKITQLATHNRYLFVFISGTMRFSRHGLGASYLATHNHSAIPEVTLKSS
jgi:hypothetical protein